MNKIKYNIIDIKKNIINIEKKIKDKNMMNNFWVIIDRADFKPLKKKITKTVSLKTKSKSKSSKNKSKSKTSKNKSKSKTSKNKSKSKSNNNKSKSKTSKNKSKSKSNNDIIIHSINEIKSNFLSDKKEYYINKKFACIKLTFDNKILNNLEDVKFTQYKKTPILTVSINIFAISENGELNYTKNNNWCTNVLITIDDLRNNKLKIKTIEVITRIIAETSKIPNTIYYHELFTK